MAGRSALRWKHSPTKDPVSRLIRGQRGSITLFVLALIPMLLVFAGLAVDLAMYMMARAELQTTMEAAALAGAGSLTFDENSLTNARASARTYSLSNGMHLAAFGIPPTLEDGDILLGRWHPDSPPGLEFEPTEIQAHVNAVLCQKQLALPTTFLRILGVDSLTLRSVSVATSNPPAGPPADGAANILPIAISGCPFVDNVCSKTGFDTQATVTAAAAWYAGVAPPAGGQIMLFADPAAIGRDTPLKLADLANKPGYVPVVECTGGPPVGNMTVESWAFVTILDPPPLTALPPLFVTARYDCEPRLAPNPVLNPVPRAGLSHVLRIVK
jgi:putative Flp pilus-assembly TadE/G-like protein